MRTIGVVTVARSDYGLLLPVLRRIRGSEGLRLRLYAAAAHFSPEFGRTERELAADGFPPDERIEISLSSDSPAGVAKTMGLGLLSFADLFQRSPPDLLLVTGDRFEMHAAGLAALPFRIPVAHAYGGDLSLGAIDDSLRHSLTKLSHLHFCATEEHAARVRRMGEEPWRVRVTGSPGLDHLHGFEPLPEAALEERTGFPVGRPFLLATFHPVTLEYDRAGEQAGELLAAIAETGLPVLFTHPNADTRGREVLSRIEAFVKERPGRTLVPNLGTRAYLSLLGRAAAMVGNSSSGILEAASFRLPVVNVGSRQDCRTRPRNVLDAPPRRAEILRALLKALDPAFRRGLEGLSNPYAGPRPAAEAIVETLRSVAIDDRLLRKRFHDR